MITKKEISDFLVDRDPALLEKFAARAGRITAAQFGKVISLYAPIYLSNYCENNCVYCGFRSSCGLKRKKLSPEQIESEMKIVSGSGIRNILLLTGESRKMSPVSYLMDAVKIAGKYFSSISLEVYPLDIDEYMELYRAGESRSIRKHMTGTGMTNSICQEKKRITITGIKHLNG